VVYRSPRQKIHRRDLKGLPHAGLAVKPFQSIDHRCLIVGQEELELNAAHQDREDLGQK